MLIDRYYDLFDENGRDYKSIAGAMLVQMYNSKSTMDTLTKLLEEFEDQIRLEINTDGNND